MFFARRTVFACVTVFAASYPHVQILTNQVLTMLAMVHILSEKVSADSASQRFVEIASEVLLLLATVLISFFNAVRDESPEQEWI